MKDLNETHLWVDIQDADLSCFDHVMDGVDLCAVQIPVILAVLQETAVPYVTLHFAPGHKGVHLTIPLVHLWLSRGDCGNDKCKHQLQGFVKEYLHGTNTENYW